MFTTLVDQIRTEEYEYNTGPLFPICETLPHNEIGCNNRK